MSDGELVTHLSVMLRPDPSRTVIRPFEPGDPAGFEDAAKPRAHRIVARILSLDAAQIDEELARISESFADRRHDFEDALLRRFREVPDLGVDRDGLSREQKLVIGGYFCEEYSFEAAALFNPSVVLHAHQVGAPQGGIRFAMALRGIGEGHVSSVTFRIGLWTPGGELEIEDASPMAVPPQIERRDGDNDDAAVWINCAGSRAISESVLFPVTASQRQGIEDLRLVRFAEDDGTIHYYGTYTAFSGSQARSELLKIDKFDKFEMHPLRGACSGSKGMALFPRRINGQYVMLGRQDNENIWLLRSDDLLTWEGGERIVAPRYAWEFVQMGNCGSPIEIDEGWLVLTHGVGSVRNYCIGACLLDKDDPSKVIKRLPHALVHPSDKERDGYVPNVVYSCGGLVHDRTLLLPYGVADSFTTFASAKVDDILDAMV